MTPFLFLIVVDWLARLVRQRTKNQLFQGVRIERNEEMVNLQKYHGGHKKCVDVFWVGMWLRIYLHKSKIGE